MKLGSEEHKNLFCRFFIYTHKVFKPADVPWPQLDDAEIKKLADWPQWNQTLKAKRQIQKKFNAYAEKVKDLLLREAIALQAYEEGRQADLLENFLKYYQIPFQNNSDDSLPADLEEEYLRTGVEECIDSFFGFGFFEVAKTRNLFPAQLLKALEPFMEEEARHILFYQNWLFYERYRRPFPQQAWHFFASLRVYLSACFDRLRNVPRNGIQSFQQLKTFLREGTKVSFRFFIELCLKENKRLLAPYDRRLVRPKLVPTLAGFFRYFL
jgi:hypothetical protein